MVKSQQADIEKMQQMRTRLEGIKRNYQESIGTVNTLLAQAKEKYNLDSLEEIDRCIEEVRRSKERATQMLHTKVIELETKYGG